MSNKKLIILVILFLITLFLMSSIKATLTIIFFAGFLAYLFYPLVSILERKLKLPHIAAVLIVYLFAILLLFGFIISFVPFIIAQLNSLIPDIPQIGKSLSGIVDNLQHYLDDHNVNIVLIDRINTMISSIDDNIPKYISLFVTNLIAFTSKLFDVMIVLVLLFYFLLDGVKLIDEFESLLSQKTRERFINFRKQLHVCVSVFLKQKALIAAMTAFVMYIGLLVFDVKYAILIALATFFLDFIPYIGSFIAGALAGLIALIMGSWQVALIIVVYAFLVQQVFSNIIAPKMQSKSMGVHAVVIIFVMLAANELWGPIGMFFSVPIAGILRILFLEGRQILRDMK